MELDFFFNNFVRLYVRKDARNRWLDKFNKRKPLDGGVLERYLNESCLRMEGNLDALFFDFLRGGSVWVWDFEGELFSFGSMKDCNKLRWGRDPLLAVDASFNAFYFNGDMDIFVCKKIIET